MSENVNHPDHYKTGNYECIEVMKEIFGECAVKLFCQMNAFKYLWRSDRKNGNEDIRKAKWYLETYLDETPKPCKESEGCRPDLEEDDEEIDTESFVDSITGAYKAVVKGIADALKNYAEINDPESECHKRYEYFKKLKEEDYDDNVAFYFAAFKDLPQEEDDEQHDA